MSYGFIVLRHVNSETTNNYWNEAVLSIRVLYSKEIKIIVIDDNSNQEYVKPMHEYENVHYVQSEYPRRGELLPFIYFQKHRYFENAIIIHDSVFIKRKINFESLVRMSVRVCPFWHFKYGKDENIMNTLRILRSMKNTQKLERNLMSSKNIEVLGMKTDSYWDGCFGGICFINYQFMNLLEVTYQISAMVNTVHTKSDRCSLERIIGLLFFLENSFQLKRQSSIFGNIHDYKNKKGDYSWGFTYQQHCDYIKQHKRSIMPVVKVWSGR